MSSPESAIFFMGAARKSLAHGSIIDSGAESVPAFERQAGKTAGGLRTRLSQVRLEHLADVLGSGPAQGSSLAIQPGEQRAV